MWSTEKPTKTPSIYLLGKDSSPDIIAGATEPGAKISLIFLIANNSLPFCVCHEWITTGIYQLHLGHRQVLEVWIVKLISNVCRCTICGYQNTLQYHMWDQFRYTIKPNWERGQKLLEANIYLRIDERQNGTEWKILPFNFSWKMKEELLFSGLDDHQYLQLSGYQQEASYYEKPEYICLRSVMLTPIMQLLDYQIFLCVPTMHFTSVKVLHKHPKSLRMRMPRSLPDWHEKSDLGILFTLLQEIPEWGNDYFL